MNEANINLHSRRAVLLLANSAENATRVFKITRFLVESNRVDSVTIIGLWRDGLSHKEGLGKQVDILRVKTIKDYYSKYKGTYIYNAILIVSLLQMYIKYIIFTLRSTNELIYCHDIILLPVAVICKLMTNCSVIYMPHELESEETGRGGISKWLFRRIEKFCLRFVKHTTVVSPGIKKWYEENYRLLNIDVIRNIPEIGNFQRGKQKLRAQLGISTGDMVYIYQGLLERTRGVVDLADFFSRRINLQTHMVFMGFGPETSYLMKMAELYENIHVIHAVKPEEIPFYTSDADIGVIFIPQGISLSYRYSLSNKLFEYILSGIPVLCSNNLESISDELLSKSIGWSIDPTIEALNKFVCGASKIKADKMKLTIEDKKDMYSWIEEVQILRNI